MNANDRERIFNALLGEPEKLAGLDKTVRFMLEDVARQELDAIEPIIDRMVSDAKGEAPCY